MWKKLLKIHEMNIIRKYKISKLLNQPLTGVEGDIILFINSWLKDLIPFKIDKHPNTIYYMKKEGLYVLEYCNLKQNNNKNDHVWIRYKDFWETLENKYLLKNEYIEILLKFIIEENFKKQIETPLEILPQMYKPIEKAFKQKVTIPIMMVHSHLTTVEEEFKIKMI